MLREKLVWERIKELFIKIIDFSVITPIFISFFLIKIINKKFGYEKYVLFLSYFHIVFVGIDQTLE